MALPRRFKYKPSPTFHLEYHELASKDQSFVPRSLLRPSIFNMDKSGRRSHRTGKSSITSDMASCASSATLFDSKISTPTDFSNSDNCYAFLSQLPPRLLFRIIAYLDIVSKICLQSTSHYFRSTTHVDRAELNTCAKHLLALRFQQASTSTKLITTRSLLRPPRKHESGYHRVRYLDEPRQQTHRCIVRALNRLPWVRRKTTLDLDKELLHRSIKLRRPQYWEQLMEQLGIDPDLESSLKSMLMPYPEKKSVWLAFKVLRCMHCGKGITEGDTRLQGCLHCRCDFCFRVPEECYRRCGPGKSSEPQPDEIFDDDDGGIYVAEYYGKDRFFVPVYNPFCWADRTHLLDIVLPHICDVDETGANRLGNLETKERRSSQIREKLNLCKSRDIQGKFCQVTSIMS